MGSRHIDMGEVGRRFLRPGDGAGLISLPAESIENDSNRRLKMSQDTERERIVKFHISQEAWTAESSEFDA
jgi:hypothetical protein